MDGHDVGAPLDGELHGVAGAEDDKQGDERADGEGLADRQGVMIFFQRDRAIEKFPADDVLDHGLPLG